jgi:hypothetical protein
MMKLTKSIETLAAIANAFLSALLAAQRAEVDYLRLGVKPADMLTTIKEHEATIVKLKNKICEHEALAASQAQQLNQANVRCAALQNALLQETSKDKQALYWFARSCDGTVVGPFSRS